MNQQEFMKRLEELLHDISPEEREEALAYYRNYFEDAGIENEEKVLRELESPEKLAASIKAGLQEDGAGESVNQGSAGTVYTEDATNRRRAGTVYTEGTGNPGGNQTGNAGSAATDWENTDFTKEESVRSDGNVQGTSDNTAMTILIIVLLVLSSPVWIGILGGLFGMIMGILGGLFGMTCGLMAGGIACVGVGISHFVLAEVPLGFLAVGFGVLLIALGLLALIGLVQFCGRFMPWAIREIVQLCKNIYQKLRKEERA